MQITLITPAGFQASQSMPRYANMLAEGMRARGHQVDCITAKPYLFKLPAPAAVKKWLGYFDQFVLFPVYLKRYIRRKPKENLFVFTDHALGPWVPYASNRKHVIHCHDFLAQLSAAGMIPENRLNSSGRYYQLFIQQGYRKATNYISISEKTQSDLHHFLSQKPGLSRVVYNGLNQHFEPAEPSASRITLSVQTGLPLEKGYILHVGGNQFYKNRKGVVEIYQAWRNRTQNPLPLICIGAKPNQVLSELQEKSAYKSDIHFLSSVDNTTLQLAYQGASVLLYPSLAEGFGWPIIEAMASGCPVITTDQAPMTEVGGNAAFYIPKRPFQTAKVPDWLEKSSGILEDLLVLSPEERQKCIALCLENAKRFDTDKALDQIESIYQQLVNS